MRKYNVFGKKLSKTKALPFMILIFIVVLAGYYLIDITQSNRLSDLEVRETELKNQIGLILASENSDSYLEIGEIMPFIPTSYKEQTIRNDIIIAKNLANLALSENFKITIANNVALPFDEELPENLKYVRIDVSFLTDNDIDAIDFMDQLLELDHIYYISSVRSTYLEDGTIRFEYVIYTYYYLI